MIVLAKGAFLCRLTEAVVLAFGDSERTLYEAADTPTAGTFDESAAELASAGTRVALQIWGDDPEAPMVQDPRRAEFANAVIDALAQSLQSAPGVLQRVMSGVASAADEVALQWGVLPDEEINALLDFLKMTRSGVPSRSG